MSIIDIIKKIIEILIKIFKRGEESMEYTASFTNDEVNRIKNVLSKLRYWYSLITAGELGLSEDLKSNILDILNLSEKLYDEYVPPFKINLIALTESEVQSVINDLKAKGGLNGWLRLDGTYYTTNLETFKKIIEWDFTDTRKYLLDQFDCDKFAIYFKSRMAIDYKINSIGVILDYSSGHAYNIIIVKDNDQVKWLLYEPQNDKIFTYDERDERFYSMNLYYLLL
jgi:hypothetical protein